ncbi:hypothetical protein GPECTOR_5g38 [Gonium pectorale]|uniref:Uncharacterized protein n=1 Tax=Gonium pectorale TaxID=33097 RepID=A0A150GX31_GONPE|nr:hypothetical protein GPECTOR_5g38 [Gonium pectorale]|eukprot:KXZ54293.1 hypothetical protein GPECTOR_5g38 [Gonium pectorale]
MALAAGGRAAVEFSEPEAKRLRAEDHKEHNEEHHAGDPVRASAAAPHSGQGATGVAGAAGGSGGAGGGGHTDGDKEAEEGPEEGQTTGTPPMAVDQPEEAVQLVALGGSDQAGEGQEAAVAAPSAAVPAAAEDELGLHTFLHKLEAFVEALRQRRLLYKTAVLGCLKARVWAEPLRAVEVVSKGDHDPPKLGGAVYEALIYALSPCVSPAATPKLDLRIHDLASELLADVLGAEALASAAGAAPDPAAAGGAAPGAAGGEQWRRQQQLLQGLARDLICASLRLALRVESAEPLRHMSVGYVLGGEPSVNLEG